MNQLRPFLATMALASLFACEPSQPSGSAQAEALPASTDSSEFSSGVIKIGVVASDFDRSYAFYTKVIGMTQTSGFEIDSTFGSNSGLTDGTPFKVAVLRLVDSPDATEWKLLSFGKPAAHPAQKFIHDDVGMQYVTIMVKDMAPFLERIRENAVPLLGKTPVKLGDGRDFVLIQDPDGNFVELISQP